MQAKAFLNHDTNECRPVTEVGEFKSKSLTIMIICTARLNVTLLSTLNGHSALPAHNEDGMFSFLGIMK